MNLVVNNPSSVSSKESSSPIYVPEKVLKYSFYNSYKNKGELKKEINFSKITSRTSVVALSAIAIGSVVLGSLAILPVAIAFWIALLSLLIAKPIFVFSLERPKIKTCKDLKKNQKTKSPKTTKVIGQQKKEFQPYFVDLREKKRTYFWPFWKA